MTQKKITIELTEEQLEQIKKSGILDKPKSPFLRVDGEEYYFVDGDGDCVVDEEHDDYNDDLRYAYANYFPNEATAEQFYLHNVLQRLLMRFALENGGIPRNGETGWEVFRDGGEFKTTEYSARSIGAVYFTDEATAKRAVKEIIEPFVAEHPNFIWEVKI